MFGLVVMYQHCVPELDLVPVAGRQLAMGLTEDDATAVWRAHADLGLPWHYFAKETGSLSVDVAGFRMQRCPMTWRELRAFVPELASRLSAGAESEDEPAEGLSHAEAMLVARFASESLSIDLRLPAEPEWELAARGSQDREYPWGDTFEPELCNLSELGRRRPLVVGSLPGGASEDGILDLAGNVDEWTDSIYEPYPGAHWTVPPTEHWAVDVFVTRGGSWCHARDLGRTRRRHGLYRPQVGAGLRLVVSG